MCGGFGLLLPKKKQRVFNINDKPQRQPLLVLVYVIG